VNIFPEVVHADVETAIHNAVTTVWSGSEVKACRFHLVQNWWRKMQYLRQAVWKERLWGKSVLEENIRTVAVTTGKH
jgi:transposase-like protein